MSAECEKHGCDLVYSEYPLMVCPACEAEKRIAELEAQLHDLTVEHAAAGPWCESCGRTTEQVNDPVHPGRCDVCARNAELEAENARLKATVQDALDDADVDELVPGLRLQVVADCETCANRNGFTTKSRNFIICSVAFRDPECRDWSAAREAAP